MTINLVSFLGRTNSQINRLNDLNGTLADLERQMSTGKKYDTLAGLGTAAQSVQNYRIGIKTDNTYLDNINTVTTRINVMSQALTSASASGRQLIQTLTLQGQNGSEDMGLINQLAKQALAFVSDLANTQIDGRYVFAGSDSSQQPYTDATSLALNMQGQVTNWLNGSQTTSQMLTSVDGLSNTQLGLNSALSASGNVTAHIDNTTDVDYTVNAGSDGFSDIIRTLGLAANLTTPGTTDTPTAADLDTVVKKILTMAQDAVAKLDTANADLGNKLSLINAVKDQHTQDVNTLTSLVSDKEDTNTTEAVAKIQALQTQLQASYQVTSLVSQLSLVNFIK